MLDVASFDDLFVHVLPASQVYAVGGRVRDEIRAELGQVALALKDADYLVLGMTYDALVDALAPYGRVDRVGASFSVIKFTRDGATVDLALPRREVSTGAGHRDFVIESGPEVPLIDDLARRDFRMNMIARSIADGKIIDPYHGRADIEARRIDILAKQTFQEDPLRMLRACQFAARFDYTLSPRAYTGITAAHALLPSVSPQRIGEEFSKLLQLSQRPSIGFEIMRTTKLLSTIWPEVEEGYGVDQNEWHAYDVYRHNLETLDAMPYHDTISRLAALLHDVGKPRVKDGPNFYRHEIIGAEMVESMLQRIALPHDLISATAHLVRHHMYSADPIQTDASIRRFIRRIGSEHVVRLFALRGADICGSGLPKRNDENERFQARVAAELAASHALHIRDLTVSGDDVIQAYIEAGEAATFRGDQRIGSILQQLLEVVTEAPERNSREILLAEIKRRIRP